MSAARSPAARATAASVVVSTQSVAALFPEKSAKSAATGFPASELPVSARRAAQRAENKRLVRPTLPPNPAHTAFALIRRSRINENREPDEFMRQSSHR